MRVFWATKIVLAVTGRQKVPDMVPTMRKRVEQRDVVQVHLDALGVVVGIEEDIDAGGLADGLVDDLGVFGHVQRERLVGERFELGGGAHRVDFLLLARRLGAGRSRLRALPGPVLLAQLGDLLLRGLVAGIDLRGVEELCQRALLVAGLRAACAPWSVLARR